MIKYDKFVLKGALAAYIVAAENLKSVNSLSFKISTLTLLGTRK